MGCKIHHFIPSRTTRARALAKAPFVTGSSNGFYLLYQVLIPLSSGPLASATTSSGAPAPPLSSPPRPSARAPACSSPRARPRARSCAIHGTQPCTRQSAWPSCIRTPRPLSSRRSLRYRPKHSAASSSTPSNRTKRLTPIPAISTVSRRPFRFWSLTLPFDYEQVTFNESANMKLCQRSRASRINVTLSRSDVSRSGLNHLRGGAHVIRAEEE